MKETLSLFLATVIILTLSVRSFKTVSAAEKTEPEIEAEQVEENNVSSAEETISQETQANAAETVSESSTAEEKAEETATEETVSQETPAPAPTPAETAAPAQSQAQTQPQSQPQVQTPAPAASTGSNNLTAAQRLNAAPLNPQMTPFAELNNEINKILSQIITPGMSTYQKMKACYTYVATHCTYGSPSRNYYLSTSPQYREYELAITVFYEGVGKCDCYSAAVSVLARAIGINCYTHTGTIKYAAGYWDEHDWAEANINGTLYIFDANVEDNVTGGYGENYFCKTYSELAGSYVR